MGRKQKFFRTRTFNPNNFQRQKWDDRSKFQTGTGRGRGVRVFSLSSAAGGEGRGEVSVGSPSHAHERYGELATPLTNIPVHVGADQIVLTAGVAPVASG